MSEEPEIAVSEETGKPSAKRLSEADFAKCRELYELGTNGISDLADKFDVSRQTLSKRFKEAGVIRGSRAHELAKAAGAGAVEAAKAAGLEMGERFADRREAWIEETRINAYKSLKQAEMVAKKIVADAIRTGASMSTIDDDLKAAHRYHRILSENATTRLEILRADDFVGEDDLPPLKIEDLTDEDILEHHKNIGALKEDATLEDLVSVADTEIPVE